MQDGCKTVELGTPVREDLKGIADWFVCRDGTVVVDVAYDMEKWKSDKAIIEKIICYR